MKKVLMYSAMLALATSCTNELDNLSIQENAAKGLTFKAEIEKVDSRAELTYDEETKQWNMFWYAEDDQLAVYSKNMVAGSVTTDENVWSGDNTATYKASRTLGEGYFVAAGTQTPMEFLWNTTKLEWYKPSFRYVWPANVTVTANSENLIATLPAINAQDQAELNGSSTVPFMLMTGKLDNVEVPAEAGKYSASDVLIGMKITRQLPLALYSVKNYDKNLHGKLQAIRLTSLGIDKNADGDYDDANETEVLDYGTDATLNLHTGARTAATTGESNVVTMTFGNGAGLEWSDNATAFMTFNTVARAGKKAKMQVEYIFDNITFTDTWTTTANYEAHQAYRMSGTTANPQYDLQAQPYLILTNPAGGNTLVLNPSFTGNVSAILSGSNVKDPFNPATGIACAITDVTRLVVYPHVADPTTFAKFTALTDVELIGETELHAGMFNAAGLTSLKANNVTKVAKLFNTANGTTALIPSYENLSLSSYLFNEGNDINALFFNNTTKSTLATLNISGVTDMVYPFKNISLLFEGHSALTTVTLNANGVNVAQKAFKGCTNLETVKGKVNLTTFDATEAFMNTAIETIDIIGSSIPSSAFEGATLLEEVKFVKASLKKIGSKAFYNCSALEYMDLESINTLGENAFNLTSLTANNKDTNVLTVGATSVPFGAFANTQVALVRFTNATTIGDKIFKNCANLTQVRFDKAFGYITNAVIETATTFGSAANVTLYVNKATQKNVDGYKLSTPKTWTNNAITAWNEISFKGIYDNAYWTE